MSLVNKRVDHTIVVISARLVDIKVVICYEKGGVFFPQPHVTLSSRLPHMTPFHASQHWNLWSFLFIVQFAIPDSTAVSAPL